MAHPGTSHLQGPHQTTLGQPQAQSPYPFFPNARDFSIVGAVFNDVHHHAEGTGNVLIVPPCHGVISRTGSSLR